MLQGRVSAAFCVHGHVILMRSRKTITLVTSAIAILVFAASVFYIASRFQWREVFTALFKADFLKLTLLLSLIHFAYIVVRAWRWRSAVRHLIPQVAFLDYYWITAVAVSLSMLTPGRLGEALKIEVMKRRGLLGRLPGIGAFALERIMDLVIVSSMAAIGLVFGKSAAPPGWKAGAVVLVGLGLLSLCGLLFFDPGVRTSLWLAQLRRGGSPKTWIQMAFLTILAWVLVAVNWQISLSAVQIHLALSQVLLLISLVTIGALLSFIPGGLGVSEMVATAVLTNMGVVAVAAQAGALVLHVYGFIAILFGLLHLGLWPIYGTHSHRYQTDK
jgi:uncharacterized membrane protein YbhN (UPF0104 family)